MPPGSSSSSKKRGGSYHDRHGHQMALHPPDLGSPLDPGDPITDEAVSNHQFVDPRFTGGTYPQLEEQFPQGPHGPYEYVAATTTTTTAQPSDPSVPQFLADFGLDQSGNFGNDASLSVEPQAPFLGV